MKGLKGPKLGPLQIGTLVRELRRGAVTDRRPLAVAGSRELVPLVARELRRDGEASAVVEGDASGAAVLVWVGPADEERLRAANRVGTPIVALGEEPVVPYVRATETVVVRPGEGVPVERLVEALARALGDEGAALAGRLPVLRAAVCERLIERAARRNGLVGAAVFVPGVDLPVLTLEQVRLVLRLGVAHGQELDNRRAVEVMGVVGAGFGLRALAREALDLVPVAGWALKGAVAYGGTRAVGEAAVRYFAARS